MKTQRLLALSFALALASNLSAQTTQTDSKGSPVPTPQPTSQTQAPPSSDGTAPNPNIKATSKPLGQYNAPTVEEKKPVVIPDRKLTGPDRVDIIRGMTAEMAFARKPFPMGKTGLKLDAQSGVITPDGQQLDAIMAGYGPALKAGDRARITDVKFKDKSIIFEINGGPVKKKKWYEHVQVSGMGGTVQPGQPTDDTNVRGTMVELAFDKFVPDLKPEEVKQLLDPVMNFNAKSATEAYMDTIPKVAKQAITDHRALVGMNREMVTYAKGRPPQKHREKDGDVEYEEWIYGTPPQEVEFIRFVGDEVVRIETMKVDGQKVVRTDPEVVIKKEEPEVAQGAPGQPPAGGDQAQGQAPPAATQDANDGPVGKPSLKRPGEDTGMDQPEPTKANPVPKNAPGGTTPPGPPGPPHG
jgi:hypothetical protein